MNKADPLSKLEGTARRLTILRPRKRFSVVFIILIVLIFAAAAIPIDSKLAVEADYETGTDLCLDSTAHYESQSFHMIAGEKTAYDSLIPFPGGDPRPCRTIIKASLHLL